MKDSRRTLPIWLLFVVILLASVPVAFFTSRYALRHNDWRHDKPQGHAWLHEQLRLNEAEVEAIDRLEPAYRADRALLLTQFRERTSRLSELLRVQSSNSVEVTHAVHAVHEIHSQLQELSIRHYFEMQRVLPPDKQARLRELAVEALSVPE